jgi:hypothetical protein
VPSHLFYLDLRHNPVTEESLPLLRALMRAFPALRIFNLSGAALSRAVVFSFLGMHIREDEWLNMTIVNGREFIR